MQKHQIHTAIETEGYAEEAVFLHVLSYIDFAFVDLKHMDPQKHEEKTGVSNEADSEESPGVEKQRMERTHHSAHADHPRIQ